MGPPISTPKSRSEDSRTSVVTALSRWATVVRGPSKMPGVTLRKTEPWNSLEPDLVATL